MRRLERVAAILPFLAQPQRTSGSPIAPRLRQLRQVCRYFPAYQRRDIPGAFFQHVEYLHVSSARRNRAHTAQPTQLVMDEGICHRRFIVENYSRGKYNGPIAIESEAIGTHLVVMCRPTTSQCKLRSLFRNLRAGNVICIVT